MNLLTRISNIELQLKNLTSRNVNARIDETRKLIHNVNLMQDKQDLTNNDLLEAITEIALLLGEEAAKHD